MVLAACRRLEDEGKHETTHRIRAICENSTGRDAAAEQSR